ncbi:hypothetical protein [Sphingomonas sp. S2-65]|uniref:hypothetical protein n=1 Tax=Sphingomonas sp. S2-65 TaxID=2903960 RepID=UPI001F215007|nr:hypothetical protein [Sphingomonas sp. S2-65]UYY60088.1 hypothetical protein LZ586_08430 [Sphingomonas sp. S2-65]
MTDHQNIEDAVIRYGELYQNNPADELPMSDEDLRKEMNEALFRLEKMQKLARQNHLTALRNGQITAAQGRSAEEKTSILRRKHRYNVDHAADMALR